MDPSQSNRSDVERIVGQLRRYEMLWQAGGLPARLEEEARGLVRALEETPAYLAVLRPPERVFVKNFSALLEYSTKL